MKLSLIRITVIVFLSCTVRAYGQVEQYDPACTTPSLDSANAVSLPYYGNNQVIESYLVQNGYNNLEYISFPNPAASSGGFLEPAHLVPLNLHLYRDDLNDPASAVSETNVRTYVCMVNALFRDAGTAIQFYVNRVEIIPSTFYNSQITTKIHVYQMWAAQRIALDNSRGINVHIIRLNGGQEDAAGRASLPQYPIPLADYSLYVRTHLTLTAQLPDVRVAATLAHEIGHTLGLLHTHHPGRLPSLVFNEENGTIANGCYQEAVSRTRENYAYNGCFNTNNKKKCEINGDFLCDTPADPRQSDRILDCQYQHPGSGNFREDNWGDLWMPPTRNVMSYSESGCRKEFSRHQTGIMWMQMPDLKTFINYAAPQVNASAAVICPNNSGNFSLTGTLPGDATITWRVEPGNIVSVSSGNGTSATLSGAAPGSGIITFSLTGPGNCYLARFQKSVVIGTPLPTGISGPDYDLCRRRGDDYGEGTYYVYHPQPGVSYQWQVVKSNGQTEPVQTGTSITLNGFRYAAGTHTLRLRSSSCSQVSPWLNGSFVVRNCSSGRMLSSYPNPTDDMLLVETGLDTLSDETVTLTLLGSDLQRKAEIITSKETEAISTSHLPEGTYYLLIRYKEGVLQRRIIVDHK